VGEQFLRVCQMRVSNIKSIKQDDDNSAGNAPLTNPTTTGTEAPEVYHDQGSSRQLFNAIACLASRRTNSTSA
jgi:hypothetical protein